MAAALLRFLSGFDPEGFAAAVPDTDLTQARQQLPALTDTPDDELRLFLGFHACSALARFLAAAQLAEAVEGPPPDPNVQALASVMLIIRAALLHIDTGDPAQARTRLANLLTAWDAWAADQ